MMPYIPITIPPITAVEVETVLTTIQTTQDIPGQVIMTMRTANGGCFGKRNEVSQ